MYCKPSRDTGMLPRQQPGLVNNSLAKRASPVLCMPRHKSAGTLSQRLCGSACCSWINCRKVEPCVGIAFVSLAVKMLH